MSIVETNGTRGVLLFNAIKSTQYLLWAKRPLSGGLTSRHSSRQRWLPGRGRFVMGKWWTQEQVEILREHYSRDIVDVEYLSQLFDRSKASVCQKAKDLGLTNRHRPDGPRITKGAEGHKYNMLTAIRWVRMNQSHKSVWEFICDCGNTHYATLSLVKYGHVKSCGCLSKQKGREAANKLPEGESSLRGLYTSRKRGATSRGLSWNIPEEVFRQLIAEPCFYCGVSPNQVYLSHRTSNGPCVYNGLDRVDNSTGYELNNVVPCCGTCNMAKSTMTRQEFLEWIARVYEHSIKV